MLSKRRSRIMSSGNHSMRIAIIAEVFLPKIDGVVNRTLNLIRQLTLAGDELMIVCPEAQGCSECSAPVLSLPSFPFPMYPEYRVGLPDKRLAQALKQFSPQVIHYLNPFAFGFRCHDVLRRASVRAPTVFSFHTLYGEFVKRYKGLKPLSTFLWWLTREYHNRADLNLTVSSAMLEELVRRGFQRVQLWPPAVDSDLFHPGRASKEMRDRLSNGHPEKRVLLTVSRLAPEKNVGFLADLVRQLPNTCLAVVGDGPDRPALERRFAGTDSQFLGYLKGQELAAAYASADAFVYASETETMGNVVLEAMACGRVVIAPNAGGIPNLLSHGKTGFLYGPRDLHSAIKLTNMALKEEGLRLQLGAAARAAIDQRDWEHSVGRVRQVYAEAIESGQNQAPRWTWQDRIAQTSMIALVSAFRAAPRKTKHPLPGPEGMAHHAALRRHSNSPALPVKNEVV
jgi:glycosyltransferase involved in cell wall biosynthesis